MDQDTLMSILSSHEWKDVEFKEARRGVPKSAYETVSAFANTEGGHLVFGVKKNDSSFEIVGVIDVDKVQNEFITALRSREKISKVLNFTEDKHEEGGSCLLIFYIPEATRFDKPIFLDGNIKRAFIRKGGCDVQCSPEELQRLLNDASTERYDGQTVDFDLSKCFDLPSLKWYRGTYENRSGNRSCAGKSDLEFLAELGLLTEARTLLPTRAAILLFGTDRTVRQILPRPVVDCQRFSTSRENADTGQRWTDRLIVESNLIQTWQAMLDWYHKLAVRPFRVDRATLQRDETPPDYVAFREATVNLLIHQDYSDHTRKPEILDYADQTVFWNPGDAFASGVDLLEPGEKEVRNPRIVTAFRRIGLSENAGWGLRDVFRNWLQLGNIPPCIDNNNVRKTFSLVLPREQLLSEEQLLFQASLGVHLGEEEARAFAYVRREKKVSLTQLKAVTGLGGTDARRIADRLVTQVLLMPTGSGMHYILADHLRERFGGASLSPGRNPPLGKLSDAQRRIISVCEVPRSLTDIISHLGVKNRVEFRQAELNPLVDGGIVQRTKPDEPEARNQQYVLTEYGARLRDRQLGKES